MNFKRKFDGLLSEEHIKQQLTALASILVFSFIIFWIISITFFHGSFKWQEIIALYLDPGVFGNDVDNHDLFRLIITSVGIFVFTALLITVFTNIFSNISNAYRKGERRYNGLREHTVILGANQLLIGMLERLRDNGSKNEILVVTTSKVEDLRDRMEAYFGDKEFMDRLIFYFDERDNERNLQDACINRAKEIFIIGEDGESEHDSISIRCCRKIKRLCSNTQHSIECKLVINNDIPEEIYKDLNYEDRDIFTYKENRVHIDVIKINEYIAEQILFGEDNGGLLPLKHKGSIILLDNVSINLIILGFTPMAIAIARAARRKIITEKDKSVRITITFIDSNIKYKMNRLIAEESTWFTESNWSYISFEDKELCPVKRDIKTNKTDEVVFDWKFIDADIFSAEVRNYLNDLAKLPSMKLAIAICQSSQECSLSAALTLPQSLYNPSNVSIYVHLNDESEINFWKNREEKSNVHGFGIDTLIQRDALFGFVPIVGFKL